MLKTHFFLSIFCLLIFVSCAKEQKQATKIPTPSLQEVQKQATIDSLINLIEKSDYLDGQAGGYEGSESEQYKRYRMLKSLLNEGQAISLTNHTNNVVKCYAFDMLVANKSDSVFAILQRHLSDTTKVGVLYGCIGQDMQIRQYFLNALSVFPLEKPTKEDRFSIHTKAIEAPKH